MQNWNRQNLIVNSNSRAIKQETPLLFSNLFQWKGKEQQAMIETREGFELRAIEVVNLISKLQIAITQITDGKIIYFLF